MSDGVACCKPFRVDPVTARDSRKPADLRNVSSLFD